MARLSKVALALDRDGEVAQHDEKLGVLPPDFALDKTLTQLNALREVDADKSVVVTSIATRTKAKNIPGDWAGPATKLMAEQVYPALDRQIAQVKEMRAKATHDAGVWKLPKGDSYYADSLIAYTTSTMQPAEIHGLGLKVVADYTARIDHDMNKLGLKGGSVGKRPAPDV